MHAFLLALREITNSKLEITNLATKHKAKVIPFILQKIEDARELKKFVKFSFSEKTAIVIENIDSATLEATNAFLKNLEEPSENLIYVLTATNINNVLPTIVSRCEIIRTKDVRSRILDKNTSYNDALNIKDRQEAIGFIENLISLDHQNENFKNMENYLETLYGLKANGNVSLQLASFVVKMNGQASK